MKNVEMRRLAFKLCLCMVAATIFFLFAKGIANALNLTYDFTGQVVSIYDDSSESVSSNFHVGDIVQGYYTIDTSVTPAYPRVGMASYPNAYLNITIGSNNFTTNICSHLVFNDDPVNGGMDGYSIVSGDFTTPVLGDLIPHDLFIQFLDNSGSVFSSTDMVINPPPLASFRQVNGLVFKNKYNYDDWGNLYFTINTINNRVPEPTTMLLLGLGLLGLAGVKRKMK